MEGWLGPGTFTGYCGNCRPVRRWADVVHLLRVFTPQVRQALGSTHPVGLGLWLPAALENLDTSDPVALAGEVEARERARLSAADPGSGVFTFNGFPYGDFHDERVKHDAYWPDWTDPRRLAYTAWLVRASGEFAPQRKQFSISTLPVGWKANLSSRSMIEDAARRLRALADHLHRQHERTGRLVHVDLEPEPGCLLETSTDVIRFFEGHLLDRHNEHTVRRYLRVCHDICHAAVMGERQEDAFRAYAAAGIEVGKVQVSSALAVDFDGLGDAERAATLAELQGFAEPRFLHQATIRGAGATPRERDSRLDFYEDLPMALAAHGEPCGHRPRGQWRVHFHVPIHQARIGRLGTTQAEIAEALRASRLYSKCRHFEVETYAWSVLPAEQRVAEMAEGVARELAWLRELISRERLGAIGDD
jgi:hypothetical protein